MTEEKYEEFRLAVVGGGAVGKSCLTVQYIQNIYVEDYDPTIEDSYRKHTKVDGTRVFLEILDTAGQEEYKALRDQYMRHSDGFLVVFDITNFKSFQEVDDFIQQIKRAKDADRVPIVIVGNKSDLESERQVKKEHVELYIRESLWDDVKYIETSAKLRRGVDEAFEELVRTVRRNMKPIILLERNIQLHPKHFGPQLRERLIQKLNSEVEGECSTRYGFIIAVTKIEHVGKGRINELGYATFHIKFRALVFRPFKNEVVDAVVTQVTKIGFFAEIGPLQIFVSTHGISSDMRYEPDTTPPCFVSEDQSIRIAQDGEVRIKIMSTRLTKNKLFAVGTIKEDFLGPIE